ncbi:MAG: ribonuclease HI [Elainella sp. Prado103]|nr:ribonuclease HI [Elainella sp. Prado103]
MVTSKISLSSPSSPNSPDQATIATSQMPRSNLIQSIYTDGACSGNPGPGGWGTVIYFADGSVQELGGAEPQTTNNRMEMQAAIAALEYLQQSGTTQPIELYTDSEYVKNGITKWLSGWKKKGWKTSTGKAVLNQDLWKELDALQAQVAPWVQWRYVKGHSGNRGNDRCDEIARAFSLGRIPALSTVELNLATHDSTTHDSTAHDSTTQNSTAQNPVTPNPATSSPTNLRPLESDSGKAISGKAISGKAIDRPQADIPEAEKVQSIHNHAAINADAEMVDSNISEVSEVPREVKVAQLRHVVETLQMADEIARQGYLITSSELADLMDVNASAVTSRGDNWVWRNWVISRVRREGNQILWQLERVD